MNHPIKIFDEYAESYASKYMDLVEQETAMEFLAEHIPCSQCEILDVGCGPGNLSMLLLRYRPQARISGIDGSPNMINLAQKNIPHGDFTISDINEISHLDQCFDCILCGFLIPYLNFECTENLIRKLSNALKSGGLFYLVFMDSAIDLSKEVRSSDGTQSLTTHFYTKNTLTKLLHDYHLTVIYEETLTEKEENDVILISRKST